MAFLERFREALIKYMAISPDTPEAEMILNDKFVTHLPPDIQRKMQKLAIALEGTLEELVWAANWGHYNWDQNKTTGKEP